MDQVGRTATARNVVIAVYPGASLLDLSGPLGAFRVASDFGGTHSGAVDYKCILVSSHGGRVDTAEGAPLLTHSIESLARTAIDTLIVPGAHRLEDVTRDTKLIRWVARRAPRCRRVCSVCVGSFFLAATGILDGRRAATHWNWSQLLARRHPSVQVEPDAIFVRDGSIWSSAGVTTGIDMALALLEEDYGRKVAMNVARMLVVYLKRAGGQSQYSALLAAQAESQSDSFGELERWIAEHLQADLRIEALAKRVNMSARNFARVYAEARGRTPAKAVEAIRMEAARQRLEETDDRIEVIARDCGYSGEEQMRSAFTRMLKIPPRQYRKHFATSRGSTPSLDATRDREAGFLDAAIENVHGMDDS